MSLLIILAWSVLYTCTHAEGFTFPNNDQYEFIVGDIVNITWDIVTPRLNLCEVCDTTLCFLNNASNTYSYLWPASRTIYRESGCVFELQPLGVNGISLPPNITSVLIGVQKRYTDDPSPTLYNAYSTTASSITTTTASQTQSTTSTTSIPPETATSAAATITATSSPSRNTSGLSTAARVGVGVGVPLGVLLSLTWLYFLLPAHKRPVLLWPARLADSTTTQQLRVRKHVRDTSDVSAMTETTAVDAPRDLEGEGVRPVSELMGSPRSELEARGVGR